MSILNHAPVTVPPGAPTAPEPPPSDRRPTGDVTFLFTDLEGSTRRWEEHPAAMREALARHDALLRSVIEQQGGYVFKTVGDAFCAAFAHPALALAAARAAQRALAAEAWADVVGEMRVRMAVHRGEVDEQDGDYFGPPLNRVARLLAAGHGGQVLLSQAARELLAERLPPGTALKDLGSHMLRDLLLPEHVFQLVDPGLPAEFPPIRSLQSRPNNLPAQSTPLVGREVEIAGAIEHLRRADVRLLTLTGPGGIGKTRLSLAVAAELLDDFPDGVFFIDLAPVADADLVLSTVVNTLRLREASGRTLEDVLGDYLRDRRILLLLDNLEQVIEAAPRIAVLLQRASKVKILATSRTILRLSHEIELAVPPLTLPDPRRPISWERLLDYEAVGLFVQRAQSARPGFDLTPDNAQAVAAICFRLEGLPLAIELAAARIRMLSPDAMLSRLSSRLGLLTGGARDLPQRQRTLRGTIQWSVELLRQAERRLYGQLGVFSGGWTLEAGEAVVGGGGDELDLLDGFATLVECSLVQAVETGAGEMRFRMLETLREYALERLVADEEAERVRDRHAEFFLALAEEAEPLLLEQRQAEWLSTLEVEHDNLRVALEWAQEGRRTDVCLRMAGALYRFWWMRGYISEGRLRLQRALDLCGGTARAESPQLCAAEAKVLRGAGVLAWSQGDNLAARAHLEQSLVASRRLGDEYCIAAALNNLANVARDEGDLDEARTMYEESLQIRRRIGDRRGVGESLNNLAILAHARGDHDSTRTLLEESLAIQRSLGEKRYVAFALNNLGDLAASRQDYGAAKAFYEESLVLLNELGDVSGALGCLEGCADALRALGDPERAGAICAATAALREHFGAALPSWEQPRVDRVSQQAREALEPSAWERTQVTGRQMTLEETVQHALGG